MFNAIKGFENKRDTFLEAMSRVAATVSVLSTDGIGGKTGVTVSSFTSISADTTHPTILTCLHSAGSNTSAFLANGSFCVNVLAQNQSHIADLFSGRKGLEGKDRFLDADWEKTETGQPCSKTAIVSLNCRISQCEQVGLHHVIFAEVLSIHLGNPNTALAYANRKYVSTIPLEILESCEAA